MLPTDQNRVQVSPMPIICSHYFSHCLPCPMLRFPLLKWILHQDCLFDEDVFDYALSHFFKSKNVLLLGILQCLKNWKGHEDAGSQVHCLSPHDGPSEPVEAACALPRHSPMHTWKMACCSQSPSVIENSVFLLISQTHYFQESIFLSQ